MSATTVTVAVGYSRRPVQPDQNISAVIVPLHIADTGDPASVRSAEMYATIEAYGLVLARLKSTGDHEGVITSWEIVEETL
jgi:hypothetical protein